MPRKPEPAKPEELAGEEPTDASGVLNLLAMQIGDLTVQLAVERATNQKLRTQIAGLHNELISRQMAGGDTE